jgi:nucleotide-binding universal stress UspA family protein
MIGTDDLIVVAFDGSADSRNGAAWAATEAAWSGAHVELLAVLDWTNEAAAVYGPFVVDTHRDDALERLRSELTGEADRLRILHPTVTVSTSVRIGSPVTILVERSAGAAMIVVGTRGVSRVAELLVGSVSHAVAAKALCAVVVVNDRPAGAFAVGPVVVGVDGSPSSLSALSFAGDYARSHGLRVDVIRACSFEWIGRPAFRVTNDMERLVAAHEYRILHEDIAKADVADGVVVTATVAYTHPVRALLDASAGASLVVVGTRGHSSLLSLVVGSVSQALIQASTCPVLVVANAPDHDLAPVPASSLAGITI